ncbi:MAG TPA: hypothetical protein PK213_14770 [Deltaproteobacteria bacterium]|jgi:hypothetical protein|nr:hypothetical protein [Deltaproteobacteria bacterium]
MFDPDTDTDPDPDEGGKRLLAKQAETCVQESRAAALVLIEKMPLAIIIGCIDERVIPHVSVRTCALQAPGHESGAGGPFCPCSLLDEKEGPI